MNKYSPDFGDFVTIEMKRYGVPNEMYTHKVINWHRSNTWVDAPVQSPATEVMHDHMEDVVSCIVQGICETEVLRYRVSDVKVCSRKLLFKATRANGEEIRTAVYVDQEGNVWKDCDPYGVQMSGKRSIIGAGDINIIH